MTQLTIHIPLSGHSQLVRCNVSQSPPKLHLTGSVDISNNSIAPLKLLCSLCGSQEGEEKTGTGCTYKPGYFGQRCHLRQHICFTSQRSREWTQMENKHVRLKRHNRRQMSSLFILADSPFNFCQI